MPCTASVLPIDEIADWAHGVGAKILVDACQSVPHMEVDVQNLNADFLVASSHKVRLLLYRLIFPEALLVSIWELRNKHASDVWAYRHWVLIW